MNKTNALRILDKEKIEYMPVEYPSDGPIDAISVASILNEEVTRVFKTLVTKGNNHQYYVFCLPANKELDLKKAALVVKVKSIEMIPQKELLPLTGYVHGGCSPIGMKKLFNTTIDESAKDLEYIYVSGGRIGLQIKINPLDIIKITKGEYNSITR